MWCLAWWPWAIAHHLYPLYTNLAWHPTGIDLAWTTCVPFLALIGAPITILFGPAVSFNLLTILAPILAAFCCYLLCLRLTGSPIAALVGGYLFGFSSFQMAESLEELNLEFGFLLPLLILVVVNRLDDRLSRGRAVLLAALLLSVEFYISAEMFATTVFFGAIAWCAAFGFLADMRPVLRRFFGESLVVLFLTTILISPLLWPMLTQHDIAVP